MLSLFKSKYVNALLIWIVYMLMPYLFGSKYVNAVLIWIQICKCPTHLDPNMSMLYLSGSFIC